MRNKIYCHISFLEERCKTRGYTLEEVRPCYEHEDEPGFILVDTDHPAYPLRPRISLGGPGSELSDILERLGMAQVEGCKCKGRARQMDKWGPEECLRRIDEIVGWLEEEAKNRKLPFFRWPAKTLVKVAIHRSQKHKTRANRT